PSSDVNSPIREGTTDNRRKAFFLLNASLWSWSESVVRCPFRVTSCSQSRMLRRRHRCRYMRVIRAFALALLYFLALLGLVWAAAALWIDGPWPHWVAGLLAVGTLLTGLIVLLAVRPARRGIAGMVVLIACVTLWWSHIRASNDRDWQPDVARLPSATIAGDRITIHNLRNFDYRSETDFTEHWETRSYDLSTLRGGDMFFCFWGPTMI